MLRIPYALMPLVLLAVFCSKPTGDKSAAGETTMRIYSMNRAVFQDAVKKVFAANSNFENPGTGKTELNIFDFDHTLANTETKIQVTTAAGRVEARDSKCFHVAGGERANFEVFTREQLDATDPIPVTIARVKKLRDNPAAFVIVITARSQMHTFQSAWNYLQRLGAPVHAVIAVHSSLLTSSLWKKMKFPPGMKKLPRGMKKPLLIGALIDYANARGARIKVARYHEDTDKYISGYMQYMPASFPGVRAEVYDYVREGTVGSRKYTEKFVAYTAKGRLLSPEHKPYSGAADYNSKDCPVH